MHSLADKLAAYVTGHHDAALAPVAYGQVVRSVGLLIEAVGLQASLGQLCWLQRRMPITGSRQQQSEIPCEVVGFDKSRTFLMPLTNIDGVETGALLRASRVNPAQLVLQAPDVLLGRVVNGLGEPIDGLGPIPQDAGQPGAHNISTPVPNSNINPMQRTPISTQLDTGIAAINALLSTGVGQRVGLFAGSGVGKSVLLGMLARFVHADVVVVGLIGERGREVQEFVLDNLGSGLARAVVVACPADDSPALRLRGAQLTTQIAERFRAQGKNVLLLMDSLTRVAQAQREIGLALGEPPTSKGYTPSAFAWLPRLVERAGLGASAGEGGITAFYTVLMEEDDMQDPIVDAARAILDGHIVLSRQMAELGIYPAIDVGRSVSRVMTRVTAPEQQALVSKFRDLWQTYREQQDLINIGAYRRGSDAHIDEAIHFYPAMCDFVSQHADEQMDVGKSLADLQALFANPPVEAVPAEMLLNADAT
ncbi:MAG: FliI/YscN family ATPase [Pseudomonadota bacterium]